MAVNTPKFDRRNFLKASATAVASMAVVGSAAYMLKDKKSLQEKGLLRPPGSIEEEDFLFACIKCGLCVQICPIHAIELADWNDGLAYGTPYINADAQACDFSCDAIQCAETCPTAAINFQVFKKAGNEAVSSLYAKYNNQLPEDINPFTTQIDAMKRAGKMGKAEMVNTSSCLAFQGKGYEGTIGRGQKALLRPPGEKERLDISQTQVKRELCDLCVTYCPLGEEAIIMSNDGGKSLPKVLDACVGCGVCQMVCPTDPVSIVVKPIQS
jgi:ferredoxin-type protein NapG